MCPQQLGTKTKTNNKYRNLKVDFNLQLGYLYAELLLDRSEANFCSDHILAARTPVISLTKFNIKSHVS